MNKTDTRSAIPLPSAVGGSVMPTPAEEADVAPAHNPPYIAADDPRYFEPLARDRVLTVDLRGTVLASWEAARRMRDQPPIGGESSADDEEAQNGVILNTSWDHVLTGMAGRNPEIFSAAKGGILSFSKSLARSVAPNVRVNILAPGWIETEFGGGLDERGQVHGAQASSPTHSVRPSARN